MISNVGLAWINVEIVNHFGINPVRGGIPLRDSSITGIKSWIIGECLLISVNWLLFVELNDFIIINSGVIISEYIMKYEMVNIGFITVSILVIHPMWVMDE